MFLSYRWLQRHVDLSGVSPEEVVQDLTLSVAEVEGLEPFCPVLGDVVVGSVVERAQHPNADKLSACKVDVGTGELLSIVCGAPNVAQGLKVAVATVGTSLPGGLKIKKAKIRGEVSTGMICSERELGLGEEHSGIWELPSEAPVGRPVVEALDALDWIIEIDNKSVTHRPDLWGHRGFARELAAIRGLELVPLKGGLPQPEGQVEVPVRIETEGCSRYLALPLDHVRGGRSPDWLRLLLLAVGQRPLDFLVDLSNFVMLDLGQPNHLFDRSRLADSGIVVRDARAGERLTTLDGIERTLDPSDMLICSGEEPVALAGVMGGEGSKVEDETGSLLLEIASFHPTRVRRTASRIGLRTDSSARFEKHLDPTLPAIVAGEFFHLLQSLQPEVRLAGPVTDVGEWSDPASVLSLRPQRVRDVLGLDVPDEEIAGILNRLELATEAQGATWRVSIPSRRATRDLTLEEDLIEEVGRIVRYARIPETELHGPVRPAPRDERRLLVRRIQDRLAGAARFHEAMGYSFLSGELVEALGEAGLPYVRVLNPAVDGSERMRRSVVPSLLGAVASNLRHHERVRLFEVGKGTLPECSDDRGQPAERHELGLVWAEAEGAGEARFDATPLMRLKGVLADLFEHLRLGPVTWERAEEVPAWANPGESLVGSAPDRGGTARTAFFLGALEPGVARTLEVEGEVAAAAVDLEVVGSLASLGSAYRPLPRFPGIKIDVALAAPLEVTARDLSAAIGRAGKGLVAGEELFDLYQGEQVGAGRRSLAWHVLLQAADRTLSDKDGQRFLDRLEKELAKLGAELRRE